MVKNKIQKSSFRDPSGFLFYEGKRLLRQINNLYKEDYDFFQSSGLYKKLVKEELIIPHKELREYEELNSNCYKIIEPERIGFISYPYEWSFSQLKDAALTTLRIQKLSMKYGMTLKDASAYNIQFHNGKPIFIDTLSFEIYQEGNPWAAYKQFCQHFLSPLALMSYSDLRLNQLLKVYIDGIPLDLASKLLPFKSKINLPLYMHLHLHANAQRKYESQGNASKNVQISSNKLLSVIHSLNSTVKRLKIKKENTEWGDYYNFTNYSEQSFNHKREIISSFIDNSNPTTLWDLGANIGTFTTIASQKGIDCIAFDIDPLAVNTNYNKIKKEKVKNLLPLILDLTNPSPAIGWNNEERMAFNQRPLPDCILALAIIHHLAISNNLPFSRIARFFSELSENLIIEFVPKQDSQVKILLKSRTDIFGNYDEQSFVESFEKYYVVNERKKIMDSERTIYWMTKK